MYVLVINHCQFSYIRRQLKLITNELQNSLTCNIHSILCAYTCHVVDSKTYTSSNKVSLPIK